MESAREISFNGYEFSGGAHGLCRKNFCVPFRILFSRTRFLRSFRHPSHHKLSRRPCGAAWHLYLHICFVQVFAAGSALRRAVSISSPDTSHFPYVPSSIFLSASTTSL